MMADAAALRGPSEAPLIYAVATGNLMRPLICPGGCEGRRLRSWYEALDSPAGRCSPFPRSVLFR